jgi:hypothetical protein
MTKLTWLGTVDYREGETPLESCTWNGVLFTAGEAVEVTDPYMIAKAKSNRFFKVEETVSVPSVFGPMPEMWTETAPDEDDIPDRLPLKRKRGRPPKVRNNADHI